VLRLIELIRSSVADRLGVDLETQIDVQAGRGPRPPAGRTTAATAGKAPCRYGAPGGYDGAALTRINGKPNAKTSNTPAGARRATSRNRVAIVGTTLPSRADTMRGGMVSEHSRGGFRSARLGVDLPPVASQHARWRASPPGDLR
jgi:hypothetical protein